MARVRVTIIVGFMLSLSGCAHSDGIGGWQTATDMEENVEVSDAPVISVPMPVPPTVQVAWGEPETNPVMPEGPRAVAETDGPYLLDTGDRLRVFVYGQPNLSRIYPVDHSGMITIPLIGRVKARGRTTHRLEHVIADQLGAEFVRNPQVNVDISQNRPFFILGEVRTAGQYPYVSGMTIQTAIAIAGGYSERANERKSIITRRINGYVEKIEAPDDYVVKPGDTIKVPERFF